MEKKRFTLKGFTGKVNRKVLFLVNAVIAFALVYFVAYQVPLLSDDYSYFLKGLSLHAHIDHYLNWSGRFITDYTSSFLLNVFKSPIYMALNSLVLIVVIMMISILPNIVRKEKKITRCSSIIFWIIFMLYWVSNPNLGQTSFWLVGSANYLWTLMWASIYFVYFLSLLVNDTKTGIRQYVALSVLGIFAGLSNEALGISVVLFTISMFFMFWKEKKQSLIVGLLSSGIGYAIMYFAPGNYARLTNEAFAGWRDLSNVDKVLTHIFERMSVALGGFYIVYLVLILMLIAVLWVRNGDKIDEKSYIFSFIFCVLSVCSIAVFVAAPFMPPRGENTSLYFALLAVSFVANILIDTKTRKRFIPLSALAAVCGVYFVFSYAFVSYAYIQTNTQSVIREGIIKDAKNSGNDTAIIPDWYFTRLAKDSDKFDMFRSGAMPTYYGLNNIEWKNINFNYAVIKNAKPINVNKKLKNGLTLTNIYAKFNAPFEQTIVFEFDNSLMNFVQKGDTILYIHLKIDGREMFVNADLDLNDFVQIGDKYYYGKTMLTPRINKLSSIDFGFYNPSTKTTSANYTLNFKKYYNN
ncbi:hypothetical protein SAMN05216514_10747 [Kandleria vitulina]|uniref:DUF6056 family protein n=1 Tax=Kandleria vitulina TaxID=1630 RepID=UPI0008D86B5F|nr:DUF6056 family protein [Kandleria vitulina]SEI97937.1 hypothetical protein SAMN05216514_10747 [Kandleria vitulina]